MRLGYEASFQSSAYSEPHPQRMFSTMYYRNKTATEASLNETTLGGGSFISSSSPSADKDDVTETSVSSSSSLTTATSFRLILRWYALIIILSILVFTGIVFVVCRLSLKAEAYRKSGFSGRQDSLLFSDYKASALPISLELDDNGDL